MKKYKVIIRGLGNVGRAAVRMILDKKSLELVGAIDVDPKKIGKDVGEIFGFKKAGVTVSDQVDTVLAMEADVVLDYTPLVRDEKGGFTPSAIEICRSLKAGKNVITTLPIYYSQVTSPELFTMIDQCAKENKVSFLPSGLLPGAYASYIPMVLSGIMGKVDKIIVESGEDDQDNYSSWVKVFGYGIDPDKFPLERLKQGISSYYISGVYEMGDRLGFKFDRVETTHEYFVADQDLYPKAFGKIAKGTLYGHRFIMSGYVGDEEKVSLRYVHKICNDVIAEPKISDRIHIEGIPSVLDVSIKGLMPLDESYVTSAAPTVNIIPATVEARPGFVQAMDLPVVVPIL